MMLTQDEIDDWYFDTPRRKIFPVKPAKEPVDYQKLIKEMNERCPESLRNPRD